MATTTTKLYGQFLMNALKALVTDISSSGTDIKACLLLDTYTFSQDNHVSYNDIKAYEVANGNGYTTGGASLTTKALSYSTKVTMFDADDVAWASSSITARYAALYDNSPSGDSNKKLLLLIDFGENKSTSSSTFLIAWSISGIFTITVA